MSLSKPPFEDGVKIIAEETVFDGFFRMLRLKLQHKLFRGGWSNTLERELFYKSLAAAAVVYDPVNDLLGLVEQFRVGALENDSGPWLLECVAGMVEPGETPEQLIRRELVEEANITRAALRHITAFYPTPGSCNEYVHLYCALCDLSNAGGVFGVAEENEDVRLNVYQADEVFSAMLQSRANNGATLIGLQWVQLNRASLREEFSSWR